MRPASVRVICRARRTKSRVPSSRSKSCAVVDPQPDIELYLSAAAEKSMRITHIFETHVQADHLSGARRLSEATGAPVFYHAAAPVTFRHDPVDDGEKHDLGNVGIEVVH